MKSLLLNPAGDMNLHTHSVFCDGKDTPAEMAEEAVRQGFRVLGFSGHGYAAFDLDCCMTKEKEEAYFRCVTELKEKYRGTLDIRLGMERDYFNENSDHAWDYEIGSVHYVREDGFYIAVDDTPERLDEGVRKYFGGDYRAFCERYFALEADVIRKTGAEIVGHFDLITKFNRGNRFFDETADWYRELAIETVRAIAKEERPAREGIRDLLGDSGRPVFEVNTGGMAKGWLDRPYPAAFLIEEIARQGCPILLSSDCHDRTKLTCGFEEARALVLEAEAKAGR